MSRGAGGARWQQVWRTGEQVREAGGVSGVCEEVTLGTNRKDQGYKAGACCRTRVLGQGTSTEARAV